ncbi:MAG: DUF3078 domain-containing protein [Bacteroidota bacterium]|nr:DUF3078 domain-containing protein [Bacteroidota bacterium]
MKKSILLLSILFSINLIQAQDDDIKKKAAEKTTLTAIKDTGWIRGGFFSTNLSNTTFSNWSQGGTNNTAIIANSSLFAIFHPASDKYIWENYLDLAYGVIRNGGGKIDNPNDPSLKITNPFVKNEDKLVFLSKYGRKINDKLNYSGLLSLNTQMFPGWAADDILREKSHVSNFLAQGFGFVSIGFDYKPKPFLSIYASPITAKYTIVREQRLADLGLYGVEAAEFNYDDTIGGKAPIKTKDGQTFRNELGWYINLSFNKDIAKNINYQSRLELFQNYKTMQVYKIDRNWQNTINMKVNKYVTVTLINQVIWDWDVDTNPSLEGVQRKVQLKNFFGVGFSAKFGDKL